MLRAGLHLGLSHPRGVRLCCCVLTAWPVSPPPPPRHQGEHDGVLRLAEALRGFGPLKPCLIALDDVWAPPTAAALFMPHLNPELHRNLVRTVVPPLPHPLHTRMQPSGVHALLGLE